MYQVKCLNAISVKGLQTLTTNYQITDDDKADAYLVSSANLLDATFPIELKAIARAGAGVNNIPLDRCAEQGIVVFNTPGANANAVKELVIASLLNASRDIHGGMDWIKANQDDENITKDAEKAKKAFAGQEILGKKIGVIGLGAIGVLVANSLVNLGMDVYGYDPYISIENAWHLDDKVTHVLDLKEIYTKCDYITIHVPLMDSTKKMISREGIMAMKKGMIVLNIARDLIVDEEAMAEALELGIVKKYVTDFPNPLSVKMKNAMVTPHLGASTEEAEDNCAVMAAKELMDYLEKGVIKNSVNFPNTDPGQVGLGSRITILHRNVPNMINAFTTALQRHNLNIANLMNKSRGNYAYTVIDIDGKAPGGLDQALEHVENVLKVRVINK